MFFMCFVRVVFHMSLIFITYQKKKKKTNEPNIYCWLTISLQLKLLGKLGA